MWHWILLQRMVGHGATKSRAASGGLWAVAVALELLELNIKYNYNNNHNMQQGAAKKKSRKRGGREVID